MADHGGDGSMWLSDFNGDGVATPDELLTVGQLDALLDGLTEDTPITVFYEACKSGSFLADLAGPNRVVLSSAGDENAKGQIQKAYGNCASACQCSGAVTCYYGTTAVRKIAKKTAGKDSRSKNKFADLYENVEEFRRIYDLFVNFYYVCEFCPIRIPPFGIPPFGIADLKGKRGKFARKTEKRKANV